MSYIVIVFFISLAILAINKKNKVKSNKWPKNNTDTLKENDDDKLFTEKCPLIKRKLMTKNERELYERIKEHIPEVLIFAQVQLSQIVFHPQQGSKEAFYWNNRINRMSVDLLITNTSFETLAVIELDDPSHKREDRKKQDQKKNKVLKDANIKVIRIPTGSNPSMDALRRILLS